MLGAILLHSSTLFLSQFPGGPPCPSGTYVVLGTQALIPILPSPPVCPHPLPTTELEASQDGGGENQSLQNHSTALGWDVLGCVGRVSGGGRQRDGT